MTNAPVTQRLVARVQISEGLEVCWEQSPGGGVAPGGVLGRSGPGNGGRERRRPAPKPGAHRILSQFKGLERLWNERRRIFSRDLIREFLFPASSQ